MDVRENLVEILQDEKNPVWRWFPNNASMMQLADYLIANGVTVQKWISVNDRLPEEKVDCIVHYKHAYCDNDDYWAIGICFYDGEKFRFDSAYKVTHWMPLPEPPKAERRMIMDKKQSGKNLLRSVQVIKYTCGAGTPEEAETNCTYFIRGECTASFCEYRMKKQTNADRIRAMSDEELASFIDSETDNCAPHGDCKKVCDDCKACWLDWLKQPAEEGWR